MTLAEARRVFSVIVDVARSKDALMDHLHSRDDTVTIWGAEEGDLHLIDVGSRNHPDYELEWETGTMPRAIQAGEPAPESARISLSGVTVTAMLETIFAEPVQARSRREAATEPWNAILSEGAGLLSVGSKDDELVRALVRSEHDVRGQLFVKDVSAADDFRVVWSQSLRARENISEDEQTNLPT